MSQEQREHLKQMLNEPGPLHGSSIVRVLVNPNVYGVKLPLLTQAPVPIDLSYGFGERYRIFVADDGVYVRLRFPDLGDYDCVFPWESILHMGLSPKHAELAKPTKPKLTLVPDPEPN